ncbi:hypothetical protein PIB30_052832 [Stylosanthes scabra]|uniref:Uncharacterized protein n=1 Tax=Stylosanthes scabra TaxID=79078 RepID=A0ABU6QI95_9FABA|nr:hypothetical protein [Stylosanthes scabra]
MLASKHAALGFNPQQLKLSLENPNISSVTLDSSVFELSNGEEEAESEGRQRPRARDGYSRGDSYRPIDEAVRVGSDPSRTTTKTKTERRPNDEGENKSQLYRRLEIEGEGAPSLLGQEARAMSNTDSIREDQSEWQSWGCERDA